MNWHACAASVFARAQASSATAEGVLRASVVYVQRTVVMLCYMMLLRSNDVLNGLQYAHVIDWCNTLPPCALIPGAMLPASVMTGAT